MRNVNFQVYQVSRWLQPSQPSLLYRTEVDLFRNQSRRFWKWMLVGGFLMMAGWFCL